MDFKIGLYLLLFLPKRLLMDIEIIKNNIIEGQELISQIDPIPRYISLEENGRYVFVGVRQAGKSYLLQEALSH